MGVTLTGKVIKNTYEGLLKLSDNTELTSSFKRLLMDLVMILL